MKSLANESTVVQKRPKTNTFRNRLNFQTIAFVIISIILGGLFLIPLITLLVSSFRPVGYLPFEANAGWTLENYAKVFLNSNTYILLKDTLIYTAGSISIGITISLVLAWLTERSNLPFTGPIFTLLIVANGIPPVVAALGYGLLVNPNNGVINSMLASIGLTGLSENLTAYSMYGMIFVTGTGIVPAMYLMLITLMKNMDSNLEEASIMSGASMGQTISRITAPLIKPGILSVFIYFVIVVFELFDVPLLLGLNGNVRVLSMEIYLQTQSRLGLPDYGLASTFGLITFFLGLIFITMYLFATKSAEKFQTVSGKAFKTKKHDLGLLKWPVFGAVAAFLAVTILVPLLIILYSSLLPFYQTLSFEAFKQFTIQTYVEVFNHSRFPTMIRNTLILMLLAPTLTILLSVMISWLAVRSKIKGARILDAISFIMNAFPAVLVAVAVLLFLIGTPLYGTIWIIILAYPIRYIPYCCRLFSTSLMQINKELEETSLVHGGSHFDNFHRVIIPIIFPAIMTGWLFVATHATRDLTLPVFLASGSNVVISSLFFEYWLENRIPHASAVIILMVILIMILVIPMRKLLVKTSLQ